MSFRCGEAVAEPALELVEQREELLRLPAVALLLIAMTGQDLGVGESFEAGDGGPPGATDLTLRGGGRDDRIAGQQVDQRQHGRIGADRLQRARQSDCSSSTSSENSRDRERRELGRAPRSSPAQPSTSPARKLFDAR